MPNTVQSVDRALKLLKAVAEAGGKPVGVRELARQTELKVPTAHDLLRTLLANGFLAFDDDARGYRLGRAAAELGRTADPIRITADLLRPWLERLHAQLGETVTAMICERGQVMVIDGIQADRALAVVPEIGPARHPHCMATGQIVLAHQDAETQRRYAEAQPLASLGPNTPATPGELLDLLARVHKRGWAEAVNVRASGIAAVAVPVLDAADRFILGIGCSAPLSRFDAAARRTARKRLIEAADEMRRAWPA